MASRNALSMCGLIGIVHPSCRQLTGLGDCSTACYVSKQCLIQADERESRGGGGGAAVRGQDTVPS